MNGIYLNALQKMTTYGCLHKILLICTGHKGACVKYKIGHAYKNRAKNDSRAERNKIFIKHEGGKL